MPSFLPKGVVFNLDGTLTDPKQRLEANMALLLAELLNRAPVAIVSGASFAQFEKQLLASLSEKKLFSRLYLFPDNAAQCFVYRQGMWRAQYDNSFSDTEREEVIEALNDALKELGLSELPQEVWGERIEDRGAEIAFSPLGQDAPLEKKQAWHDSYENARRSLHQNLVKRLPNFSVSLGGLTTIEITRKGMNKAYAVERFAELTKIPLPQLLYVGDALEEGGSDAVVVGTGIHTHEVFGPEETAALIRDILPLLH